jgi:hypothetical protein
MSLIQQETETITRELFVITCIRCGHKIKESTESEARHIATQTGNIGKRSDNFEFWICDDCTD